MSNTDILYSRLAGLKAKADELEIEMTTMRRALLVLRDQIQRQDISYIEGCGVEKEVLEKLRPICIMDIKNIDALIEGTDMLIKDPVGLVEILRQLDLWGEEDESTQEL